MRRAFPSIAATLVLTLTACSGGTHQAAPPTTAPALSTTAAPTAATPNPDVIPNVITAGYVNAVFAVLNHINGNAARVLVTSRRITSDVRSTLRAIYNDPLFSIELRVFQQSVSTDFTNVRRPPGDRVTVVLRVLSATHDCILVSTRSNLSAVQVHPTGTAASEYWQLRPKQPGADPDRVNPTPWGLSLNQAFLTPTSPSSDCSAA
jgi:hypothetical protein